jgi:hypothetical protein
MEGTIEMKLTAVNAIDCIPGIQLLFSGAGGVSAWPGPVKGQIAGFLDP